MSRTAARLGCAVFVALISIPGLLSLVGARGGTPDDLVRPFPPLSVSAIGDDAVADQFDAAFLDRLPMRWPGRAFDNWLDRVSRDPVPEDVVRRGLDGWYFLSESLQTECRPELERALDAIDRLADATGREGVEFAYLLAPDKAALVPQFVSPDDLADARCFRDQLAALDDGIRARSFGVSGVEVMQETGRSDLSVRHESHWSSLGATLALEALSDGFSPGAWDGLVEVSAESTFDAISDMGRLTGFPRFETYVGVASTCTTPSRTDTVRLGGLGARHITSDDDRRIGGSTVMVRDSFVVLEDSPVACLFNDVWMVHWDSLGDPAVHELVRSADRIALESAQRLVADRVDDLDELRALVAD